MLIVLIILFFWLGLDDACCTNGNNRINGFGIILLIFILMDLLR